MKKYEAVIILNPNLSSKASDFEKISKSYLRAIHLAFKKKKMWAEDSLHTL